MTSEQPAVSGEQPTVLAGQVVEAAAAGPTPWQQYVLLLRRLDAERSAEQARTATQREEARIAASEVERLAPILIEQGAQLGQLAQRLGVGRPRLSAAQIEVDPGRSLSELVARAAQKTRAASSAAHEAQDLARRPLFLPRWSTGARNSVVYLAWALVAAVLQWVFVAGGSPSVLLVLVIIPAIAFAGGMVSVGVLCRAPLAADRPGRTPRLGAVICFGLFPIVMVIVVLRGAVS